MKSKGFTLLELLIVIGIIGVLAGVVMISYPAATKKAKLGNAMRFSDNIRGSLQQDMIAWWKFDEGLGTAAKDTWWNQIDGTISGNADWVEGIINGALNFDRIDDQVSYGNPSSFPVTGAITIEFWAYPKNYGAGRQNPICKAYGGEFCMTMEPGSSINMFFGTAGANATPYINSVWPVGTLVNNEWIHIAWTKDPAKDKVIAYKNGKVVQTRTCGIYCNTTPSSLSLLVGNGYAGRYLGYLDDIRIYSAALPMATIEQHYASGLKNHKNLLAEK